MKILIAAIAAALLLTGCGERIERESAPVSHTPVSELLPPKAEPPEGSQRVSFGRISAELPVRWRETDRTGHTAYIDDETKCAYMFCTEGQDLGLSEKEILEQYRKQTPGASEAEPLSEVRKTAEGVEFKTAALAFRSGDNDCLLKFIFSHGHNYFAVFKGEAVGEENVNAMKEGLEGIVSSAEIVVKNPEMISGNVVDIKGADSSTVEFYDDGSFLQYYSKNNVRNERLEGTYQIFRGRDALAQLDKQKGSFDIDFPAQYEQAQSCLDILDYYCVVLTIKKVVRWGNVANTKSYTRLYTGVKRNDKSFSMYEYKAYAKQTWELKGKAVKETKEKESDDKRDPQ
ncbi:MAG: hypothetical protein IKP47_00250 [Ruminococcus sp.]|nr:hypothetical protein [Ruminococcus sp.]